jgi:hypothetical protein
MLAMPTAIVFGQGNDAITVAEEPQAVRAQLAGGPDWPTFSQQLPGGVEKTVYVNPSAVRFVTEWKQPGTAAFQ